MLFVRSALRVLRRRMALEVVAVRQSRGHDHLGFEERLQSEQAELATDARLLVAAEWRQRVVSHAVDRDPSGLESARDGLGVRYVGGEHVGVEPEGRVVRDGDV